MDIKTRPVFMLPTRDPLQNKGHLQTESEGLEKEISLKWRPKKPKKKQNKTKQKTGMAIVI